MKDVRPPAVAGLFYPADPGALNAQLDGFLGVAKPTIDPRLVKAIVAPHAGYVYSGAIAGSVFGLLADRRDISRVILIGPAHRLYFSGIAAPGAKAMRTPLGDVMLGAIAGVPDSQEAHAEEHCLEVELPFLQRVLPGAEVVPLLVGDADASVVAELLAAQWGGSETLLVVSSDLSHYLSYDAAQAIDRETADRVLALDASLSHDQACGATPLNALMHVAKQKRLAPALIDLRNSGDTAGDKRRVVGYAGFAFAQEAAP